MIDFDSAVEQFNEYLGSEKKTTVLYNGELYMLKYPDPVRNLRAKGVLSYKNNQYSEYIGSRIFTACGLRAQETLLGYWTDAYGKRKVVVACKDFTQYGGRLIEAKKLSNQTLVDDDNSDTTIENVYDIINACNLIENKRDILDSFWDMFVIDALIGNRDRHFSNWGLLVKGNEVAFAPVYDCGSALGAMLSDAEMASMMDTPEFKQDVYNVTSCYRLSGKRIFYHEIFKDPPEGLHRAVIRIYPAIDMSLISKIIDDTPTMSKIRKEYLTKAVNMRYDLILRPARM